MGSKSEFFLSLLRTQVVLFCQFVLFGNPKNQSANCENSEVLAVAMLACGQHHSRMLFALNIGLHDGLRYTLSLGFHPSGFGFTESRLCLLECLLASAPVG